MQPFTAPANLRASRTYIDNLKGSKDAAEPRFELSVVFAMLGVTLFQTRYEDAAPPHDEAHQLHLASRNPDEERDRIDWMRAVNLRYLGRSDDTLPTLLNIARRIDAMPHLAVFTRL